MIGTLKALAIGCAMSVAGMAATCTTTTWTFSAVSGGAQCGSGNSGVTFTQGGESITILPEYVIDGVVQTSPGSNVNGLFEVGKGQNGNLASGIGPFVASQGGSPYTGQQGIQDVDATRYTPLYDTMLYIEVNQATIPSGTTLSFVMQEGDVADNFNVYTSTPGTSTTVPNLSSMTEILKCERGHDERRSKPQQPAILHRHQHVDCEPDRVHCDRSRLHVPSVEPDHRHRALWCSGAAFLQLDAGWFPWFSRYALSETARRASERVVLSLGV